jgi:hypothetical protein
MKDDAHDASFLYTKKTKKKFQQAAREREREREIKGKVSI